MLAQCLVSNAGEEETNQGEAVISETASVQPDICKYTPQELFDVSNRITSRVQASSFIIIFFFLLILFPILCN